MSDLRFSVTSDSTQAQRDLANLDKSVRNIEKVTKSFELGETVTPKLIIGNADDGNSGESKEDAHHDDAQRDEAKA